MKLTTDSILNKLIKASVVATLIALTIWLLRDCPVG